MTSKVNAVTKITTMVSSRRSRPARIRSKIKKLLPKLRAAPAAAPPKWLAELFSECQRLVDQFLAAGHFLGEFFVDRLASLDERVLVGVVDLHAGVFQFLEQAFVEAGGNLVDFRLHFDGRVGKDFLYVGRQTRPACAGGDIGRRIDVSGHRQIFLHFVEARRINLRQRIFLAVHHAGLQRDEYFGKRQGTWIGAVSLEHFDAPGAARHAQFDALKVARHLDRVLVVGDLTEAVLPAADDVIAGLFGDRLQHWNYALVADFRHVL